MTNYYSDHLQLSASVDKFMASSMASTNYSSVDKCTANLDIFQDAQTFRLLDLTQRQSWKNAQHLTTTKSKESFKKLSKRPIYQQMSKNLSKKGNFRQKDQLQKKIKNQQPKYLAQTHKKDQSIQQLELRCIQLDEQLKKLKLKQRRTTNNSSRTHKNNNQYLSKALLTVQNYSIRTVAENKQTPTTHSYQPSQSSLNLHTAQSQTFRNSIQQPQKTNHFFAKLKRKLDEQVQKIKQKSDKTLTREITSGCEIKKLTGNNYRDPFRTPVTDRVKSKTAITRSGICTSTRGSVKAKRPQSARARLLQSKELNYKIEKFQQQDNFDLRGIKIESFKRSRSAKTTSNIRYSEPQANKTLRHVSPLHKQKNWSASKRQVQQQKIKEKVLNILLECQNQAIKGQTIEQGIKVFESYTKQMSKKLAKKSKLLNNIQQTQTIEENEIDEGYH